MRMWGISPKCLCRKHLLGAHVESHMFQSTKLLGKSVKGYVDKGLVEFHYLNSWHEDLKREMFERGYKHNSEMPYIPFDEEGKIDSQNSLKDLESRCPECGRRIKSYVEETLYGNRFENEEQRDLCR